MNQTPKADPNISAKIILDSINPFGNRLTTYVLRMPRIILAEFNTHRMISRNAASSRAIPFEKMLKKIEDAPFIPVQFGKNQKGMQAGPEITDPYIAENHWLNAKDDAINNAKFLANLGVHKQIVNRIIENYGYVNVLASATSFHNLFKLRAHKDAQPEFQVLAYRMLEAYMQSEPQFLDAGEWHLPFGDRMPDGTDMETKKKISTARAARLSYETFDGEININSDIALHDDLSSDGHWSPFEHPAMSSGQKGAKSGNFTGFIQYRSYFENECGNRLNTNLEEILANKPEWI